MHDRAWAASHEEYTNAVDPPKVPSVHILALLNAAQELPSVTERVEYAVTEELCFTNAPSNKHQRCPTFAQTAESYVADPERTPLVQVRDFEIVVHDAVEATERPV
jgi:hypothetical protein